MTRAATDLPDWPRACGVGTVRGVIRARPEDFLVEEELGFDPDGEGEHAYLLLQKRGLNTDRVAAELATLAGVPRRQVSYSGMKDRHAVTRQWFSVHLPGRQAPDWRLLDSESLTVLRQTRHRKKLRRGVHRGNRFEIRLSDASGDIAQFEHNIRTVAERGVPNYFGEQRFGVGGSNLSRALAWFNGDAKPRRQQQGFYLSAARSWLFNQVLARRVETQNWLQLLPGELCMLDGSRSLFLLDEDEREMTSARVLAGDVHPTGPLHGSPGKLLPLDRAAALEAEVVAEIVAQEPLLIAGLEQHGLQAERRALRVIPKALQYELDNRGDRWSATLGFSLPRGCFATAVMRELCGYTVAVADAA